MISATIAAGIILILMTANLAPFDRQCAWVFPQIFSCLLSARESLAAGLIATGGAIFAAWLAWTALQDQIGMARKNEAETKRLEQQKRVMDAGRNVDLMRIAHGFVESLANEFPQPKDPGVSSMAFATRLLDLRNSGRLHLSANAARAPDGHGDSVATVIGQLNILADNVNDEIKSVTGELHPAILRKYDSSARDLVAGLRDLEKNLAAQVTRYQAKFEDLTGRDMP